MYWGQGFALHNGSTRFAFENIVPAWLAYPRAADVALYFGLGAYRVGVGDGGSNENSLSGWSTGRALADQVAFLREQGAGGLGPCTGTVRCSGRSRLPSPLPSVGHWRLPTQRICIKSGGSARKSRAALLCGAAKCGILYRWTRLCRNPKKQEHQTL